MTAAEIAEVLGLALSTVSLWLKRIGLGKRSRLEPPEPPNRYERRHPGELVHVDIKKLGRISERGAGHRGRPAARASGATTAAGGITGFEYVHVMVDDHSRLAYAEVLADAQPPAARSPSCAARVAWFAERGVADRGGDERQRLLPTSPTPTAKRSPSSACATYASGPTARAPTARPSASSRRCSTNGPTRASTAAQHERTALCRSSSSATTTDDHTAPSATNRRPQG